MTPRRVTYEHCTACGRVLLWVGCSENDASPASNRAQGHNGSPNAQGVAGR